jgi:hypothetical protein
MTVVQKQMPSSARPVRPSPSFVGEPGCNGIMERWIRTLKEE